MCPVKTARRVSPRRDEALGPFARDEVATVLVGEVEDRRPTPRPEVLEPDAVADDEVGGVGGELEDPGPADAVPEVAVSAGTAVPAGLGRAAVGDVSRTAAEPRPLTSTGAGWAGTVWPVGALPGAGT